MRYFKVLLKEYFTSPAIYAAAGLFALLCIFGRSLPLGDTFYSVMEVLSDAKLYNKACEEFLNSSYFLAKGFRGDWFEVAAPVITAFPALAVFAQNYDSVKRSVLIRMNRNTYCGGLFASAYFSGVIISLVGILIYILFIVLNFPPLSAFPNDMELISSVYGETAFQRLIPLLKTVLVTCLVSGIFPTITIVLYQLVRDNFLSITIPMMIMYVSMKGSIAYGKWLWLDDNSTKWIFKFIYILFPSNCMQQDDFWDNSLGLSFVFFFIMTGIWLAVLYIIFAKVTKHSVGEGT